MTSLSELFFYMWLLSSMGVSDARTESEAGTNRKLKKRLAISDRYEYELGTCLDTFDANVNTIIRTQESRVLGAKFINVTEVGSKEDCLKLCCETTACNVIVYEEKSAGSCYLFDCGSPDDFRCKFAGHDHYTSAILSVNRHNLDLDRWSDQSKHEQELTNLRIKERIEAPTVPPTVPHTTSTPAMPPIKAATKTTMTVRRCNPYQFECRSNGECLAIYNACDGIPQCTDGSDEGPELACPNNPDLTSAPVLTPAPGINNPELAPAPRPVPHLRLLPSSTSKEGPLNPHETYILAQPAKPQQQSPQPHLPRPQQHQPHHQQPQSQQSLQPPPAPQQPYGSVPSPQQHSGSQHPSQQPKPASQAFKYLNPAPQQQPPPQPGGEGRRRPVPLPQQPPSPPQQRPQVEQRPPSPYLNREGVIPSTALEDQWSNYQRQQPSILQPPRGYGAPAYDDQGSHIFTHKHSGLMEEGFRFNPYETKHASPLGASSSSAGAAAHEGPLQDQFNLNGNYERLGEDGYMGAAANGNANYNFFNPRPASSWSRPSAPSSQGSPREGGIGESLYHNGNHMAKMGLPNYPHPEPQYELASLDYYDDETGRNRGNGYYNSHLPPVRPLDGRKPLAPDHVIHVPYDRQDAGRKTDFKDTNKEQEYQTQDSKKVTQTVAPPVTTTGDVLTTPKKPEAHPHTHAHTHSGKKQKDDMVTTSKVPKPVQHLAGISQLHVSLAQVEVETAEASQSSGAVLALTLGLSITAILLVLVGCRLRAVRRRLLRNGRSPYAHDADYLVNGMYL